MHCRFTVSTALLAAAAMTACGSKSSTTPSVSSSRAYKGHENDADIHAFVDAYPATVGTRLDDCQTCHKSGTFTTVANNSVVTKNACDYCHLIQYPVTDYNEPMPETYAQTLNPYGVGYLNGGRNMQALQAMDPVDTDGDGFANGVEIAAIRYPGDPKSMPGQPTAPMKTFSMAQLQAMPAHTEFLLNNSTKQQYDDYAVYTGVEINDLLTAAGVDPTDPNITGITAIAPDGFMKDFASAKINTQYPPGQYWPGLDTATVGTTCGFVTYPSQLPAGLADGGNIPDEQWLMLGYGYDGGALDVSSLDPSTGQINGQGPYRLIVPQTNPGKPDRGSQFPAANCNDCLNFNYTASSPATCPSSSGADHNASSSVRGVVAVRINPLPDGYEDFDAKYGGWAFIDASTVIVYGYGITQ